MDYQKDIKDDAFSFLSDIIEDVKQAIIDDEEDISEIDCDISGYGDIRDAFNESVTDRAYTIEDAAYIIANCEDEETDTGLWGGCDMHRAIQTCAAYSYANDVWAEVVKQYDAMYEEFEPSWKVIDVTGEEIETFEDEDAAQEWIDKNDPKDEEGYEITEGRGNIDQILQERTDENTIKPIEIGGTDELFVLKRWVKLAGNAGAWGGYPMGGVYIDSRCGVGYSMPNVKDFYEYDRIASSKVPSMVGKWSEAVKERISELEGKTAAAVRLTVEIEGNNKDEIITRLQHIGERIGEGDTESHDWKMTTHKEG